VFRWRNNNWPGSRICKKKNLRSFFKFRILKIKNIDYPFWRIDKEKSIQLIEFGGWHFSYMMKPEDILKKIESMAHTEFNKEKFKNLSTIKKNIENGIDPFQRNIRFKKVAIDNTYPKYIRSNLNKFESWILE